MTMNKEAAEIGLTPEVTRGIYKMLEAEVEPNIDDIEKRLVALCREIMAELNAKENAEFDAEIKSALRRPKSEFRPVTINKK